MDQINSKAISDFFAGEGKHIFDKAEKTVKELSMTELLHQGVLVGLSGGADSVMLLCFLIEYRRRNHLDFSIAAAHINHGIRGDEADRDERFCEELCKALGVELITRGYSVPTLAKSSGQSLEEAARIVRYLAFSKIILSRTDIKAIAVAHNMSDNAETVLFNILRGSGARGASGIAPVRDDIIRPLIRIPKKEIDSSLMSYGIPFVTDSTNLSDDYTRNYIRHEVIPSLSRITSDPERSLTRFGDNMRSDESFIMDFAESFLAERNTVTNQDLLDLHYSVYVRVLSLMANKRGGGVSAKIAGDIHSLLHKDNFSYSLIGNYVFICERGVCRVANNIGNLYNFCFEVKDGVTDLSPLNAVFVISKEKVEKTYSNVYKISIQANISSAIISGSLYLRSKKDGDTVYYGGMTHKLKKLFCDSKIPPSKRSLIPILCDDKGVVWVPGFGVRDDGVKKENRQDLYVLLGIKSDEPEEERLYSGSEFRK